MASLNVENLQAELAELRKERAEVRESSGCECVARGRYM